jgi:hypothetical protein
MNDLMEMDNTEQQLAEQSSEEYFYSLFFPQMFRQNEKKELTLDWDIVE